MSRARRILCAATIATLAIRVAADGPKLYTVHEFDASVGRIGALAFSSDGRLLVVGGEKGLGVWDAQTGDPIRQGGSSAGPVNAVAVGGQGIFVAFGSSTGRVGTVDLRSGATRDVTRHNSAVTAIALSADGRLGVSGDKDGNLLVWEPEGGSQGSLQDGGHKKEVLALSFDAEGQLISASADLRVVTWDVSGKRPLRRATLQSELRGRAITPNGIAVDREGTKLVLAAQSVTERRGGIYGGRDGQARPGDLKRENSLIVYDVASGISSDPVRTGDAAAERVAASPGGCFAFFTSTDRSQARLHVWGLIRTGDDLLRTDLQGTAVAVAMAPAGQLLSVATEAGRVRTWRVSGAGMADCRSYTETSAPQAPQPGKAVVIPGSERDPLIQADQGIRVAVMRFEVTALDPTLGDGVAEMVSGQLANTKGVVVVERAQIDAILREMEIQRSGLTAADAVRIGKGLNVNKVILGGVRKLGDSAFHISARIVDVATQQQEGYREVQCQNCREQDLPTAVEALRRILVR